MRMLWTFVKVVIALCLAIPLSIIVLATALGVLGALVGIAIVALKLAVAGLIAWGLFRLIRALLGGSKSKPQPKPVGQLPQADPYYSAAMRELDRDLGEVPR